LLVFFLHRIRAACPELLDMSIQSNLFKLPSNIVVDPNSSDQVSSSGSGSNGAAAAAFPNTPRGMADRFGVPYLGKLPMDPNMMKACEEGKSFLEAFPGSAASGPFAEVVAQIVAMTPDV
jgi:hypothetical protein